LTQKVFSEDIKVFMEDTKVFFEDRRKHQKSALQYCRGAIKVFFEDTLPLLPISTYNIYPVGGSLFLFVFLSTKKKEPSSFYDGFYRRMPTITSTTPFLAPSRPAWVISVQQA
jgi:hypothetical protein